VSHVPQVEMELETVAVGNVISFHVTVVMLSVTLHLRIAHHFRLCMTVEIVVKLAIYLMRTKYVRTAHVPSKVAWEDTLIAIISQRMGASNLEFLIAL
jgi:hypothetical protein